MANKRFLDFTTDETPSGSSFILEADSVNGVRKTTIEKAVAATDAFANINNKVTDVFYNNYIAHNGIYRGKDITSYFESGQMSADIANNNWDNIYIGDYIVKTVSTATATYENVRWHVAAITPHINKGDVATSVYHVLMISHEVLQKDVAMNQTASTNGGYLGSDMWNVVMPIWATAIKNAFGSDHILRHRELLVDAVSWQWVDVDVNIPNESMVFGAKIFGNSGFNVGDFSTQLPLFAYLQNINYLDTYSGYWLRSVASDVEFVVVSANGSPRPGDANSHSNTIGIRPYFLLK